jgi:hypothetical protein
MWTAEGPHYAVTSLCLCGCCMTHYVPWQLVKDTLIPLEGSATSRYKYLLWLNSMGDIKYCYLCLIMLQVFSHFRQQTDKTVCILCTLKILWPLCEACSFLWNVSPASSALYRETVNSNDKMAAWNQWKFIWNRQKVGRINWTVRRMLVQQNSVETRIPSCEVVLKCSVFSLFRSCYEVKSKVIFVR